MTKHDDYKPKQKGHNLHHQKKVFDVVRPGKVLASPNSRSVIVGHKPQVHDDQFVPSEHWASDPTEKKPLMDGRKKITLTPGGKIETDQVETNQYEKKKPSSEDDEKTPSSGLAPISEKAPDAPAPIATEARSESKPVTPNAGNGKKIDPKDPSLVALEHLIVEQVIEEPAAPPEAAPVTDKVNSNDPAVADDRELTTAIGQSDGLSEAGDDFWDKNESISSAHAKLQTTPDDLLAQTDAPTLEPQKAVVSQHHPHASWWEVVCVFFLVLFVAAVALNFLLDAEVIKTDLHLPHTELIGS